jgi:hypothetical protein
MKYGRKVFIVPEEIYLKKWNVNNYEQTPTPSQNRLQLPSDGWVARPSTHTKELEYAERTPITHPSPTPVVSYPEKPSLTLPERKVLKRSHEDDEDPDWVPPTRISVDKYFERKPITAPPPNPALIYPEGTIANSLSTPALVYPERPALTYPERKFLKRSLEDDVTENEQPLAKKHKPILMPVPDPSYRRAVLRHGDAGEDRVKYMRAMQGSGFRWLRT